MTHCRRPLQKLFPYCISRLTAVLMRMSLHYLIRMIRLQGALIDLQNNKLLCRHLSLHNSMTTAQCR